MAYNQETVVSGAVCAALSQTYTPLQVILSDDCSSDKTFDRMLNLAKHYRGPHEVVLNRNSANIGLARHINRVMDMASGDIIVGAAGDDVSVPWRTQRIVDFVLENNLKSFYLYSACNVIDLSGHRTGQITGIRADRKNLLPRRDVLQLRAGVLGAGSAWSRSLFTVFGDLPRDANLEDVTLSFRAALCGVVGWLEEPLVDYRIGEQNAWARARDLETWRTYRESRIRVAGSRTGLVVSLKQDLQEARNRGILDENEFRLLLRRVSAVGYSSDLELKLTTGLLAGLARLRQDSIFLVRNAPRELARVCASSVAPRLYYYWVLRRMRQSTIRT